MAKTDKKRKIHVYADWHGLNGPVYMGELHAELMRGKEIFSFEYDTNWLKSGQAQLLDPDLQLYTGMQYLNNQNKSNFGMFLDSSPDRWGRILMLTVEEHAREAGHHSMIGAIDADNTASIAFHEALGYVEAGRVPQSGFKFDRWLDVLFMQKFL